MERLTKKYDVEYEGQYGSDGVACDDLDYLQKVYDKLGKYEDITEELGIDLTTLTKALKYGVYTLHSGAEGVHLVYDDEFTDDKIYYLAFWYFNSGTDDISPYPLFFEDYGKTWALTKEELENV